MEGLADNKQFLEIIKTNTILTIYGGETTMEDIFMKVTGELNE